MGARSAADCEPKLVLVVTWPPAVSATRLRILLPRRRAWIESGSSSRFDGAMLDELSERGDIVHERGDPSVTVVGAL